MSVPANLFLKAWADHVTACQSLFEHVIDKSSGKTAAPMPLPFVALWAEYAGSLGMSGKTQEPFKPDSLFANALPALGSSREYQEIGRRVLDLSRRFQQRHAEFLEQGARVAQNAMNAIQKRSDADATLLSSPVALYGAWIDSAEQAYAQAAHDEGFARLLGDLFNILSSLKIERGRLLEHVARHLDLPSRGEVDSLHRQVRHLTSALRQTASPPATAARKKSRKSRRRINR